MTNHNTDKRPLFYLDNQLNQKRQVKLKTCADVYDYWRTCKRLYKKAPRDGVEFQIDYIDTGLLLEQEHRSRAPIALALHGAPGSYHDFTLLIHHLSQQNVRVIAPNFPEYIATVKTKVLFRHSADEKAAYLRDFLRAIHVNKIDLLVSHSSAIFPSLLILLNANNKNIPTATRTREQQSQTNTASNCIGTTTTQVTQQDPKQKQRDQDGFIAQQQLEHSIGHCSVGEIGTDDSTLVLVQDEDEDTDANEPKQQEQMAGARHSAGQLAKCNQVASSSSSAGSISSGSTLAALDKELLDQDEANSELDSNNNDTHDEPADRVTAESRLDNTNLSAAIKEQVHPSNGGTNGNGAKSQAGSKAKGQLTSGAKGKKSQDVIVQFDQPIEIKAVALFNPAGHRLPKSMKPTWFKCGSCRIYQHKLGRSLFRKLGPAFLTIVGVPVRVDNMDNVMLSATVMRNSKCHRVASQLEQLSEMKLPTLLVFSENDKLIEKEIFYEMTRYLKSEKANFDIFNNEGDVELSRK